MPPTPTTALLRDTSISSQPTPTSSSSSSSLSTYVHPLIIVLTSISLLVFAATTMYLRRLLTRKREVRSINHLNVDVSIDVYTNMSEPEIQDHVLSSARGRSMEPANIEEPPFTSLNASNNLDHIQTGTSSVRLSIHTPAIEPSSRKLILLRTGDSNLSLAGMLGPMDVDFFTRSTVRFPRDSGTLSKLRSVDPAKMDETAISRATGPGEVCMKTSLRDLRGHRTRQRTMGSFPTSASHLEASGLHRTVSQNDMKSSSPNVLSRCGRFKDNSVALSNQDACSITVPSEDFSNTILTGNSSSVEMDISDVELTCLHTEPVQTSRCSCTSWFTITGLLLNGATSIKHLSTEPSTPGRRPRSTVSSLLPVIPHCSPLILTSLTPLQSDRSPSYCVSPPFIDLGTTWQNVTPLMSLELDIDGDNTWICGEPVTSMELEPPLPENTATPGVDNVAPEATPHIFVHSAATQSSNLFGQLDSGAPSSNLLEQPDPLASRSTWYETSTSTPPIQDIARVLQPVLENMSDERPRIRSKRMHLVKESASEFEARQSASSLLSAFALPITETSGRVLAHCIPEELAADTPDGLNRLEASTHGSLHFTPTSPRSAAHSRCSPRTSQDSAFLLPRSSSIGHLPSRPVAPTPGSAHSRTSSPSSWTSPSSIPHALSDWLTFPDSLQYTLSQRSYAHTPGSVLSEAQSESLYASRYDRFPEACRPTSCKVDSSHSHSPYLRPCAPTPGSDICFGAS